MSIDNNFNHVAFLWNIAESLRGTNIKKNIRYLCKWKSKWWFKINRKWRGII